MGHRLTTADILPNQACLCLEYFTEEVFWGQNIILNTKATIAIDSALMVKQEGSGKVDREG